LSATFYSRFLGVYLASVVSKIIVLLASVVFAAVGFVTLKPKFTHASSEVTHSNTPRRVINKFLRWFVTLA
jgi:L-lactate permease